MFSHPLNSVATPPSKPVAHLNTESNVEDIINFLIHKQKEIKNRATTSLSVNGCCVVFLLGFAAYSFYKIQKNQPKVNNLNFEAKGLLEKIYTMLQHTMSSTPPQTCYQRFFPNALCSTAAQECAPTIEDACRTLSALNHKIFGLSTTYFIILGSMLTLAAFTLGLILYNRFSKPLSIADELTPPELETIRDLLENKHSMTLDIQQDIPTVLKMLKNQIQLIQPAMSETTPLLESNEYVRYG